MSEKARDDAGQYSSKVTDQDILKVFDFETSSEEPMLKTSEIVNGLVEHFDIHVSGETVRRRLEKMQEEGLVASKQFGARAVGWTALVAPALSKEIEQSIEQTPDYADVADDELTTHEELKEDLGIDG
jgi:DNA-binding Lrp family transcriptional regulator